MQRYQHWLSRGTALAAALALPISATAHSTCDDDAMLVFDGSGSMSEMGFNQLDFPRIVEARRAMHQAIPQIASSRRIGLVLYGPTDPDGCDSVDLRFGPHANAGEKILTEIDGLEPAGNTPLTEAVARATDTLIQGGGPGIVVLVTDGKETCGGAPCQLAADLAATSPLLSIHVVGFKVRGDHFAWSGTDLSGSATGRTVARCLADQTGGTYHSTESVDELASALIQVLGCATLSKAADRSGRNRSS